MKDFLTSFMAANRNLKVTQTDSLRDKFDTVMALVNGALGRDAFRPEHRLNTAVFDAVMVGLAHAYQHDSLPDPKTFTAAYEALFEDPDFITATSDRTSHAPNVEARLRLAREAFCATEAP